MPAWLSMLPISYALSALMLWGVLDVGERKRYRGRDGIKRLLLHSLNFGSGLRSGRVAPAHLVGYAKFRPEIIEARPTVPMHREKQLLISGTNETRRQCGLTPVPCLPCYESPVFQKDLSSTNPLRLPSPQLYCLFNYT